MNRQRLVSWILLAAGLAVAGTLSAQPETPQFSAQLVQQGPKGEKSISKTYVGDERTRLEMSQEGQDVVRITDQERHVEWILFPKQHKYMEHQLPPGPPEHPGTTRPSPAVDPCAGMPGMTCKKLGEETVNGRASVEWEIEMSRGGQTLKSTQWIDKERGVPLRQEFPNGQTMDLKYIGPDTVDGRKVEKWEMVTTMPKRPPMRAFQWYDPALKLVIRQEFPGGFSTELKDIKVGKQPDDLFSIPAGYERISMPNGPQGGGGAPPPEHQGG
jgi:hypothetical protein